MKKAQETRTVGFSITGDFITEHVRNLWQEGEYAKAIDMLECLEGSTHEQHREILAGTKKLVGMNDLDLAEDNWSPDEDVDYPTFREAMTRGDDWQANTRLREDAAWKIAWNDWPGERTSTYGNKFRSTVEAQVAKLVGAKRAKQIIEDVHCEKLNDMREFHDSKIEAGGVSAIRSELAENYPSAEATLYAQTQSTLMINAIEAGADLSTVPTIDALMNRGTNIKPVVCNDMSSKSGWLLPNGNYYGCGTMEHIGLAETLLTKFSPEHKDADNAEQAAEDLGWIKISSGVAGLFIYSHRKPTKKQTNKLWDYSVLHKKDYEDVIRLLPLSNV